MGILSKAPTPYKGQKYEELKKQHQESETLFEDPEFPATDASLFYSRQPPGQVTWKRPGVIVKYFLIITFCLLQIPSPNSVL